MTIRALEVAKFLGKEIVGSDREVISPCSVDNCIDGGLIFIKRYDENILSKLSERQELTAIVTEDYYGKLSCTYILSDNPRLDFARVLQKFFISNNGLGVADTARIGSNISLEKNVSIGEYSVIGNNVIIGDGTEIRHHVVIGNNTVIGKNCLIKSNTVIGEEGFGFERDENGVPIRIPHLGRVVIGDNVEIGASTVIARGTLDDTIIENNVKIDDKVFIAHNVLIGDSSMVIAESEVSGSVHIGKGTWLGPNCCILNGISIGSNCLIGLGTVVTKSLPDNVIAVGCPARIIRQR